MFMYSFCYVYVFLLLCTFRSVYSDSLCCSVYCLCVNVYCTTAAGCQPNYSQQIYHIISYHIYLRMGYFIIDGYDCCVVDRYWFFSFLQNCGMYRM